MRIRIGLVLCLLISTLAGVGCRKALTPNVDRNQAPETWITAAPQDTITLKDAQGRVIPPGPDPTVIPFKFHVYWAGSDPDGEIAGFYYAVVETLPVDPLGGPIPPPLPGPKVRDYRFTTRTDSTFIFSVSDQAPDREHAFFIYAVDNDGRPDPTPARVIFNSQDRYPPLVEFELARATGLVFERLDDGTVVQNLRTYDIRDSADTRTVVSDTVPATARLDFRWRSEPVIAGNPAVRYNYKLDEVDFVVADSSVRTATYNTRVGGDVVAPGLKQFTLRAIDRAGWRRETKRRFQFNLAPTTWFSGPDVNAYPYATEAPGYRYYDATTNFTTPFPRMPELTGSLLSRDSVFVLPANRPERKTFFEIYRNRIYVRAEYDTVHMNSWVLVHNGGLDADAPYDVQVNPSDPEFQALVALYGGVPPVLQDAAANGSPIGFRSNFATAQFPTDLYVPLQQTSVYPILDPTSPVRDVNIGHYWNANVAGLAFLLSRSEDAFGRVVGGLDEEVSILEVPTIVAKVGPDLRGGDPTERRKRRKILAFYVNRAPRLQTEVGAFSPRPSQAFASRNVPLNLLAEDADPYNAALVDPNQRRPGGPTTGNSLRWTVTVRGVNNDGRDTSFVTPSSQQPAFSITVPSYFAGTSVSLDVQLCDCLECETIPGSGRCINQLFPITVPPPTAPAGATSIDAVIDESGPGSVHRRSAVR
jgi:hypothetical protein